MLGIALVLACGLCVAAGVYVAVMLIRELPRLRNKR